jgi:heme/copper-type cytochrome/quinol oxidase subunit 2
MSSAMTPAAVLAHNGGGSGGELVMTIMFVTVLSVIWIALGVLCWVFWRAKKREDAAMRGGTPSFSRHESEPNA